MPEITEFRCPFEVKGLQEGTIIQAQLSENKRSRIEAIRAAYELFHARPESPAIRLTLPKIIGVMCRSLQQLYQAALPFQAEVAAVNADIILSPLLAYQAMNMSREAFETAAQVDPLKTMASLALNELIAGAGLRNAQDLSEWLLRIVARHRQLQPDKPDIVATVAGIEVLTINESGIRIHMPEDRWKDRRLNPNTFVIVRSPLYPRAFGRYNDDVEIVITREADVASLSEETRRTIGRRANEVYASYGVRVEDGHSPPLGVWVPEFK